MKKNTFDKNFKYDPNYVAATPTRVLKAVRGETTIIRKLYGPVTPEREAQEQKEVEHRAEQLNPVPKRPERFERDPGVYVGRDEARDMKRQNRMDRADRAGQAFD